MPKRIPKGLLTRIDFYKREIGADRDKLRGLSDDVENVVSSTERGVEDLDHAIMLFESRLAQMRRCRERIVDGKDELESIMDNLQTGADSARRGVRALEDAIDAFSEYV